MSAATATGRDAEETRHFGWLAGMLLASHYPPFTTPTGIATEDPGQGGWPADFGVFVSSAHPEDLPFIELGGRVCDDWGLPDFGGWWRGSTAVSDV